MKFNHAYLVLLLSSVTPTGLACSGTEDSVSDGSGGEPTDTGGAPGSGGGAGTGGDGPGVGGGSGGDIGSGGQGGTGGTASGGATGSGGAQDGETPPPEVDGECACSSSQACASALVPVEGGFPKTVHRCVDIPGACGATPTCDCLPYEPCFDTDTCQGGFMAGGTITCGQDVMP